MLVLETKPVQVRPKYKMSKKCKSDIPQERNKGREQYTNLWKSSLQPHTWECAAGMWCLMESCSRYME